MTKKEKNPERNRLVKELLAEYQPKTILELQDIKGYIRAFNGGYA